MLGCTLALVHPHCALFFWFTRYGVRPLSRAERVGEQNRYAYIRRSSNPSVVASRSMLGVIMSAAWKPTFAHP